MAYVSFSNYNGSTKNNEQPSIYKNYGQYGANGNTQPLPPQQPNVPPSEFQSIKPPQGIRPSNNMVPRREDSFSGQNEQNPQNPENLQNVQHETRQVMQKQYEQNIQQDVQQNQNSQLKPRVFEIESDRMFDLLTNHNYHLTPDQKPMRVVCKVYTEWCKPCKDISPFFDRLSADPEFSEILFVQLNADHIQENLAQIVKVSAVPVFIGFIGGKQVDFIPGPDREKVYTMCKKLASIA